MNAAVDGISLVTIIALIRKEIAESRGTAQPGKDGKQGAKGERGAKGDTGPQGKVGPKGGDGKQGKAGKDGKDGKDGEDAEEAVSIANIEQDLDDAIIITMTDGETYTIEMPLGKNTEVHYKVSGGGSGSGGESGSIDLSGYVEKPTTGTAWMVYKKGAPNKGWAPVTTDLVATNPEVLFRDAKGKFKSTENIPELNNQLEVNRWLLGQIELNSESIDNIGSVGYDDTQIKADLAQETQDRIDGDAQLQSEIDAIDVYDDTGIKADLAKETQDRIDGDANLQGQIDAIDVPDLDGYATEEYVDDSIAAIEFPEVDISNKVSKTGDKMTGDLEMIKANGVDPKVHTRWIDSSENSNLHIQHDGNTRIYVGRDEVAFTKRVQLNQEGVDDNHAVTKGYVDSSDRHLQAEIEELFLALETLLVQREHGQWKYIGFSGDNVPRNAGEFSLAWDDLSSSENIITLNPEDLQGITHGFGDVEIGDYVEIVDLDEPANYVLFVTTSKPDGSGITNVNVALKDKGQNFLVGETCEIRFFSINEQDISMTDLDNRYLKLSGGNLNTGSHLGVSYLDPVGTPFVYYEGDPDGTHPCGLVNRGMMSNYVESQLATAQIESHTMLGKGSWGNSKDNLGTNNFYGLDYQDRGRNVMDQYTYGLVFASRFADKVTKNYTFQPGAWVEVYNSNGELIFSQEIDNMEVIDDHLHVRWEYAPQIYRYNYSPSYGTQMFVKLHNVGDPTHQTGRATAPKKLAPPELEQSK